MAADRQREGESATNRARYRLATYGSLAPGRPNHHQLDGLEGRWSEGDVYGRLVDAGWGASLGYPALIPTPMARRSASRSLSRCSFQITGHASMSLKDLAINAW